MKVARGDVTMSGCLAAASGRSCLARRSATAAGFTMMSSVSSARITVPLIVRPSWLTMVIAVPGARRTTRDQSDDERGMVARSGGAVMERSAASLDASRDAAWLRVGGCADTWPIDPASERSSANAVFFMVVFLLSAMRGERQNWLTP